MHEFKRFNSCYRFFFYLSQHIVALYGACGLRCLFTKGYIRQIVFYLPVHVVFHLLFNFSYKKSVTVFSVLSLEFNVAGILLLFLYQNREAQNLSSCIYQGLGLPTTNRIIVSRPLHIYSRLYAFRVKVFVCCHLLELPSFDKYKIAPTKKSDRLIAMGRCFANIE